MRESQLEAKVGRYAKKRGVLFYKFVSPQNRGVPDRILVFPNGVVAFMELKRPGGKLTPLQEHTIKKFKAQNAIIDWFDDYLRAVAWIDGIMLL